MPSPIPVIEVNSGCANPVSGTRRMNVNVTKNAPVAKPCGDSTAQPRPPRYTMFSTMANPVAHSPQ